MRTRPMIAVLVESTVVVGLAGRKSYRCFEIQFPFAECVPSA